MKKIIEEIICYFLLLFKKKKENIASILVYHSISKDGRFFSVTPNEFEKQIQYLKENDFNVVSLDKILKFMDERFFPKKTVSITFDDGYMDNFEIVYPLLKKFDFPFTIFVSTDNIGKEITINGIENKFFDWEEAEEMESSGLVFVEPHTVHHKKIHKSSYEQVEKEVVLSKKEIENRLNKICNFFAYPSGRYSEISKTVIKDVGILLSFTVDRGLVNIGDDRYVLKRNSVDSKTGFWQFVYMLYFGKL